MRGNLPFWGGGHTSFLPQGHALNHFGRKKGETAREKKKELNG